MKNIFFALICVFLSGCAETGRAMVNFSQGYSQGYNNYQQNLNANLQRNASIQQAFQQQPGTVTNPMNVYNNRGQKIGTAYSY